MCFSMGLANRYVNAVGEAGMPGEIGQYTYFSASGFECAASFLILGS